MIGIGTDKVDLDAYKFDFVSLLGKDDQSWGYSYRGLAQHNSHFKYYGKTFSRGCIIGTYLDLERGTLEFYLNRRPLGKAFNNIPMSPDVKLYPMVCSTSAKTTIKLINATSVKPSLQFYCMKVISRRPKLLENIQGIPGLAPLINNLWFLQSKEQFEYTEFEMNNLLLEDEAVIGSKKKKFTEESCDSLSDEDDLYKNTNRILKHFKQQPESSSSDYSSDSSADMEDFYCNHSPSF